MQKILLLMIIGFVGGLSGIASKFALQEMTPGALIFARFWIACLCMLPFYGFLLKKSAKQITKLLLLSSGMGLSTIFYAYGIETTNVGSAQAIFMILPAVTLVFSHFILQERIQSRKILGILIGLIGISIIFFLPKFYNSEFKVGNIEGNIYIILSVLSYTVYMISAKGSGFSNMQFTLGGIMSGAILGSIISLSNSREYIDIFTHLSSKAIGSIVFISLMGTIAFYFLIQQLIKISSPFFSSFSVYLQLIFSTYFGFLFFDEYIGIGFFIGSLFTIYGVYFINNRK